MDWGEGGGFKVTALYLVPVKLRGGQNKFPASPTPLETRGTNVTVCPANICGSQSGTSITEMLSA
jgi:hypothetical protein